MGALALIAGVLIAQTAAQVPLPDLSGATFGLQCDKSSAEGISTVQFEPTFLVGDPTPMAAIARVYRAPVEVAELNLTEAGRDATNALVLFTEGGLRKVEFRLVRGSAGWVLESVSACDSGARELQHRFSGG